MPTAISLACVVVPVAPEEKVVVPVLVADAVLSATEDVANPDISYVSTSMKPVLVEEAVPPKVQLTSIIFWPPPVLGSVQIKITSPPPAVSTCVTACAQFSADPLVVTEVSAGVSPNGPDR
jgi:hypothetical protein